MMTLILTPEQAAAIEPHIATGQTILGRVMREQFDGNNAGTSGRLMIELGTVPTACLPALREAIREAMNPATKPRRKPAKMTPKMAITVSPGQTKRRSGQPRAMKIAFRSKFTP